MVTIQGNKPHAGTLEHLYLYQPLPSLHDLKMLNSLRCGHTPTLQGVCAYVQSVFLYACVLLFMCPRHALSTV